MAEDKAKFTTELNVEGAEATKAALKGVAEGTGAVSGETAKLGKGLQEQAKSVKAASASVEDYKSLLTQIHPALGMVVEVMDKGSKIAGELATKQIKLGKAFAGATDLIKTHGKTLALLGAGGAAIGAVLFLVSQVQKLKEEWADANKQLQDYLKATADTKQSQREQREVIRDLLEIDTKRAAAAEELNLIQSKVRGATRDGLVSEAAAIQATIALYKERGELAALPIKLIEDTARAIELGEGVQSGGGVGVRALQRGAASNVGAREERAATEERAAIQAGPGRGEDVSVGAELVDALKSDFVSRGETAPSREEISAVLKAQELQQQSPQESQAKSFALGESPDRAAFRLLFDLLSNSKSEEERQLEVAKEKFDAPDDLTLARMLEIKQAIERLAQEQAKQSGGGDAQAASEPTVVHNHHNERTTVTSQRGGQAGARNGESVRSDIGVG